MRTKEIKLMESNFYKSSWNAKFTFFHTNVLLVFLLNPYKNCRIQLLICDIILDK